MLTRSMTPIAVALLVFGSSAAIAQTTKPAQNEPAAKPDATTKTPDTMAKNAKITLTEQQANSWVDKPVYSSDGKEIGEVVAFKRGADNVVTEMHLDVGGTLGMGETRVKVMPQQFKLQNDRVVLNLTEAQAKDLPKIES